MPAPREAKRDPGDGRHVDLDQLAGSIGVARVGEGQFLPRGKGFGVAYHADP
jgi:hypothetical protein